MLDIQVCIKLRLHSEVFVFHWSLNHGSQQCFLVYVICCFQLILLSVFFCVLLKCFFLSFCLYCCNFITMKLKHKSILAVCSNMNKKQPFALLHHQNFIISYSLINLLFYKKKTVRFFIFLHTIYVLLNFLSDKWTYNKHSRDWKTEIFPRETTDERESTTVCWTNRNRKVSH